MEDGSCDTVVISTFHPERLDPGEVLKAPAPRDNISDHLIEVDMKFLHRGKHCREHAITCIIDFAEPQGPEWKSKRGLQRLMYSEWVRNEKWKSQLWPTT